MCEKSKQQPCSFRLFCLQFPTRIIKNAAYAWRQAIFFLSLSRKETISEIIGVTRGRALELLGGSVTHKLFTRLEKCIIGECSQDDNIFFGWTLEDVGGL